MEIINDPNFGNFWKDKRVLITGHTGFKGSWLTLLLGMAGAKITGIALPPLTTPNLFVAADISRYCNNYFIDVRELNKLEKIIRLCEPEIVFHLAAQPLVQESYKNPLHTYSVNIMGTLNLLECLRGISSVKSIVISTTDKVYKKNKNQKPYTEDDSLGGNDPYSASKAAVEILVNSYQKSYFDNCHIGIATTRAGNLIGGGDWSENRIIPDLIKSWVNKKDFVMRNPSFIRPWQYVLEPVYGYTLLAKKLYSNIDYSGPYNFGPVEENFVSVDLLVKIAQRFLGDLSVVVENQDNYLPESDWLALDSTKSKKILNFSTLYDLDLVLQKSVSWFKRFYSGENINQLCESEINDYVTLQSRLLSQ